MRVNKAFASCAALVVAAFVAATPASALSVETKVSAEFQKKLEKEYGVRERDYLSENLGTKVERSFSKSGLDPARVVLTIEDAVPNRPTFRQLGDKIGLDPIRSISIGGARVSGVAYDSSGKEMGSLKFEWYDTDIRDAIPASTWTDATWAFSRFAEQFAKKIR